MNNPTHLDRLEGEAIHIMREVVAEAENPVFLYSVGKDSSVMLHLAAKAFQPSPPPFPFLHIESGWDSRDLLTHRDRMARHYGLNLLVERNHGAERQGITPFDTPTGIYAQTMLIDPLKAALDRHGFDVAFDGARRDGEFGSGPEGSDPGNVARHHLRAARPGCRPRRGRLHGKEEAGWLILRRQARPGPPGRRQIDGSCSYWPTPERLGHGPLSKPRLRDLTDRRGSPRPRASSATARCRKSGSQSRADRPGHRQRTPACPWVLA